MKELEIEINEDGVMIINRKDNDHNDLLLELMKEIEASNIDELKDFLKHNNIDLLFGDEILCG